MLEVLEVLEVLDALDALDAPDDVLRAMVPGCGLCGVQKGDATHRLPLEQEPWRLLLLLAFSGGRRQTHKSTLSESDDGRMRECGSNDGGVGGRWQKYR